MYTYESSEQGDLSFQQGDIVVVTRKEGDWWTGMVGGKTGVFPSNYVKPRDSSTEVRDQAEFVPKDGQRLKHVCVCNECFLLFVSVVFGTSREDRQPWEETR